MPPKMPNLQLQLDVESEGAAESELNASFGVEDTGTINVLTKSLQKVSINRSGLTKDDLHYKISQDDVKILKRLGQGASSVVHKGFIERTNDFVALKKINVFERDTRRQLMNDLRALIDAPDVPGLVKFHGAFNETGGGQICIVLEYMDGGSLADVLQQVGKIPEAELSRITEKLLGGLSHLHKVKHMVHRDLKPANILLGLNGDSKISDFGISAFVDSTVAVCRTFLGTVTYMSPERINNQNYSFPADIWSLGLALTECATGSYPYDASGGPLQLMVQVVEEPVPVPDKSEFSPEFVDFVTQCMSKNPVHRPSADDLLQHPFILKHRCERVDLRAFLKCVDDPCDKLDDVSVVFAANYYRAMSRGAERIPELSALYSDTSALVHEGRQVVGRSKIIERLREHVKVHDALGGFSYRFTHVDCQPIPKCRGHALILVQGQLVPKADGDQQVAALGTQSPFAETFVLGKTPRGGYFVQKQMFRLFK